MRLPILALLIALFSSSAAMAQKIESSEPLGAKIEKKERIIKVAKFHGQFIGFQFGDYLHATFLEKNGKERSFYLKTEGIDYFLTQYKGRSVHVTYEVVDKFIPEAGERVQIEQIVDVRVGAQRFSRWWQEEQNKMTPEEIRKRYEPLVEKAMM